VRREREKTAVNAPDFQGSEADIIKKFAIDKHLQKKIRRRKLTKTKNALQVHD